jgi:Fic/DOC family
MEVQGIRMTTSAAVRERRLAALLQGRDPADLGLLAVVEEAQLAGSLELAGTAVTPADLAAVRAGAGPEAVRRLRLAQRAVPREAALTISALKAWHETVTGGPSHWRRKERPDVPGAAPVSFIEGRLQIFEHWLGAESRRELTASQAGALVMARLLEIVPFEEGNGLVARLAVSHVMLQAGARPPLLRGADRARLDTAVSAAFDFMMEPLATLLDEAADRALDVMIQALA